MTTVALAMHKDKIKIIAPAMNTQMYLNSKDNISGLKHVGWKVIDPVDGKMACGDTGLGKLPKPRDIVNYIVDYDNNP